MRVPSCKTEHLAGGDHRFIPLFPELVPYLQDALELADPGSVHVITRYRRANQNLRTQLLRIIARAGEEPWPKLWHNLRSSRQTELEEQFPTHVVCAWLGNGEIVARGPLSPGAGRPLRAGQRASRWRGTESGTAIARTASHGVEATHRDPRKTT